MIFFKLTCWRRPPWRDDFERVRLRAHICGDDKPYLHLEDGPTGFESMPVFEWTGRHWSACAGCDRYDELVVPKCEMGRVVRALCDRFADIRAEPPAGDVADLLPER